MNRFDTSDSAGDFERESKDNNPCDFREELDALFFLETQEMQRIELSQPEEENKPTTP